MGSSYPWFVVHLKLGLTRFYRLFNTLITMAWGLSLVGAVRVVLGWVAWEVVIGEVLVTWFFITFYVAVWRI